MGHISEIIDSLAPWVPAHVVVTDLDEWFGEDLEAELRLGGVGRVELRVNLASSGLAEDSLSIDEGTVANVEVQVRQGDSHQAAEK